LERPKGKDRYEKLRITEKNYQAVKNVHVNWYTTSLKALMGQMGKHLYETLSKGLFFVEKFRFKGTPTEWAH
jgi:hypothetical protein